MGDTYTHGHHESVVGMHAARTATNSAGYLLDHLRSGMDLLDVGCGPGTITVGLAEWVAPGRVIGIDIAPGIVEEAARAFPTVHFEVADVYDLPYETDSFDVAHAHQVLQHVTDPVRALREMRRVTRPGGIVAARDVDYATMTWYPLDDTLDHWLDLYHRVARGNGAEPDAGRRILSWYHAAGFETVEMSAVALSYGDDEGRRFWGRGWERRALESSFAEQAVAGGHATEADLQAISAAWRRWSEQPDGYLMYTNAQAIGRA